MYSKREIGSTCLIMVFKLNILLKKRSPEVSSLPTFPKTSLIIAINVGSYCLRRFGSSTPSGVVLVSTTCVNADNNPKKSILFEAVGDADEIYVVVEMGGYLYLTRGAVLSYREFIQPIDEPRLTDEEWQKQLETNPRKGVPEWMKDIVVPLKKMPEPNEEVFYSSGC